MTLKIINSGNKGSESGSLAAAWQIGIQTGGHILQGYKTSNGYNESLKIFGLEEHPGEKFSEVVKKNIENSDGTLVFLGNIKKLTKPEIFTREFCEKTHKPILNMSLDNLLTPELIKLFIEENNIETLHITGKLDNIKEEI
jgi:hypothetical protein